MKEEKHFTLDELSALTALPRRTIRFYMQTGLVPRPVGANRGAYYLTEHLDRLLEIRKWQSAGISLKRIRELLIAADPSADIPENIRQQGEVIGKSHVFLRPGVELVIDPAEARMTNEEILNAVRKVLHAINETKGEQNETE